jgi:hypothetical protein
LFLICYFISLLYFTFFKLMIFDCRSNLFVSLNFWRINMRNMFSAHWSFSSIFLLLTILFFTQFTGIIIHTMDWFWYFKFLPILIIWNISLMMLLLIPIIFIFLYNFGLLFRFFIRFLFRLVTVNIIFNFFKNFLIDLNCIWMKIKIALLWFTNPVFFRDHTHICGLWINKTLFFLEIRWLDTHLIRPS